MRWIGLLWLAVWLPSYWIVWGWPNLLFLCDVAVLLTCIGLWRGSALILSSQAVSSIIPNLLWCVDVAWRLLFSHHLIGGTEYLWDARFPLWVRLLSLFHLVWPPLLLWGVRRTGYDRRALAVQSAIAAAVMIASRWIEPARNLNFAHRDPIFARAWGPAPAHLALMLVVLIAVIYWPTHQVLARCFPSPAQRRPAGPHNPQPAATPATLM